MVKVATMLVGLGACYEGAPARGRWPQHDSDGAEDGDGADAGETGEAPNGSSDCTDTRRFFEEEVWRPILQPICFACHNPDGAARSTALVLLGPTHDGYLEANYHTVQTVAALDVDGTSLLLLKPTAEIPHEGQMQIAPDSAEYEALEILVDALPTQQQCTDGGDVGEYFDGLVLLDEEATLRKAMLLAVSRLPTPEESAAVRGAGMDAVTEQLGAAMKEPAFYARLAEMFNDTLLTDAYLAKATALETLDPERFPNAFFYASAPTEAEQLALRDLANDAIAREPLHLVAHVVREGRPFTEVLTADYTLVNPYSARAYGIPLDVFEDPDDPGEYVEYRFDDLPQAGLLSTSAFLARYPSTDTNRNRHRSRMVYDFFLATDVMRLASRPIDADVIDEQNPTRDNAQCNVCHDNVDPIAGAFQNRTNEGWYRPRPEGWYADMLPPAFGDEPLPPALAPEALRWLGEQIVADPRFALATVHVVYEGLTGQAPLREPTDPDHPHYVQHVRAFEAQDHTLKQVARAFEDAGFDVEALLLELVTSPWFRAVDLSTTPDDDRRVELAPLGTARLLPPEILERKIVAAVGFPWQRGGEPVLTDPAEYLYFYGGIDSSQVTTRLTDMNGVMANIVSRMGNELACAATAWDFSRPAGQRLLFPHVELDDMPGSDGGREAIEANIAYLHRHLLDERVDPDDPEVRHTYELFEAVHADGWAVLHPAGGGSPIYPVALPDPCQATVDRVTGAPIPAPQQLLDDPDFTVRAWQAVLAYLLSDYRFLYE
jgi:hypothetical protein